MKVTSIPAVALIASIITIPVVAEWPSRRQGSSMIPMSPSGVRVVLNGAIAGTATTDDFLKGDEDELYIIVTVTTPSAKQEYRWPTTGAFDIRANKAGFTTRLAEFDVAKGDTVDVRFAIFDDDSSPVAEINVIADALRKSENDEAKSLGKALAVLGVILGANKDDVIGAGSFTVGAVRAPLSASGQLVATIDNPRSLMAGTEPVTSGGRRIFFLKNDGGEYVLRLDISEVQMFR